MSRAFNKADIEGLQDFFNDDGEPEVEDQFDPDWEPEFKPMQQKVFDSQAPYMLAYGERFSGKSFVVGHKLVRHLWREFNAHAVIIVGTKNQAMAGGIWHKLLVEILPQWCENTGMQILHEGRDDQKNPYIDVMNRHGGRSRVSLVSAPWPEVLINRIRGYEISFLMFEEATTVPPVEASYFRALIHQVGRRPGIEGVQQYCVVTNPDDPKHWIYRRWFVDNHDNPDYHAFHVPMEEAREFMPKGYYEKIMEGVKGNDVLYRRLFKGEWVAMPSGTSIFLDYFFDSIHVRGDQHSPNRIVPNPDFNAIIGYDPGPANNALVFLQHIPTTNGFLWVQFDEMVYLNRKLKFRILIPALIRRMHAWNDVLRGQNPDFKGLRWEHIADNSAFNQSRQSGDYDVLEIERESVAYLEANPGKFPGIIPIRMREAPKFNQSKKMRVTIMQGLLENEEYVVDSHCIHTRDMFNGLESEESKKDFGSKGYDPDAAFNPKRSPFIHVFDALTYPILRYAIRGKRGSVRMEPVVTGMTRLGG